MSEIEDGRDNLTKREQVNAANRELFTTVIGLL